MATQFRNVPAEDLAIRSRAQRGAAAVLVALYFCLTIAALVQDQSKPVGEATHAQGAAADNS